MHLILPRDCLPVYQSVKASFFACRRPCVHAQEASWLITCPSVLALLWTADKSSLLFTCISLPFGGNHVWCGTKVRHCCITAVVEEENSDGGLYMDRKVESEGSFLTFRSCTCCLDRSAFSAKIWSLHRDSLVLGSEKSLKECCFGEFVCLDVNFRSNSCQLASLCWKIWRKESVPFPHLHKCKHFYRWSWIIWRCTEWVESLWSGSQSIPHSQAMSWASPITTTTTNSYLVPQHADQAGGIA